MDGVPGHWLHKYFSGEMIIFFILDDLFQQLYVSSFQNLFMTHRWQSSCRNRHTATEFGENAPSNIHQWFIFGWYESPPIQNENFLDCISYQIFTFISFQLRIHWPANFDLTPQSQSSLQGTFDVWTDIKVLSTKANHGEAGM